MTVQENFCKNRSISVCNLVTDGKQMQLINWFPELLSFRALTVKGRGSYDCYDSNKFPTADKHPSNVKLMT
jgi:hypothetical protein